MLVINSFLSHDVKRHGSMGKHKDGNDDWRISRRIFDNLNREFSISMDVGASRENKLCDRYFDITSDALEQCWQGESLFCNPSYSQFRQISKFMKKAYEPDTGVFIAPARLAAVKRDCTVKVIDSSGRQLRYLAVDEKWRLISRLSVDGLRLGEAGVSIYYHRGLRLGEAGISIYYHYYINYYTNYQNKQ